MRISLSLTSIFLCMAFSLQVFAQDPNLPIDLSTPHKAMLVHLNYLQSGSYEPEKAALALEPIQDTTQRSKLAIQLKQVFDGKGLYVRFNQVPDEPDFRDTVSGKFNYTPFPVELPEVYLERDSRGRWRYAKESVMQITDLHKKVYPLGADILVNLFPSFGQKKFLGLAVWQYIGLACLLLLTYLINFVFIFVLKPVVRRLARNRKQQVEVPKAMTATLARYLSVLLSLWVIWLSLPILQLPPASNEFAMGVIRTAATILVVLVLLKVMDIVMQFVKHHTLKTESRLDEQLMPIIKGVLQVLIVAGGLFHLMQIYHIDVTALVAGLSIGSLALALAAKDTVSNLFGSVTIFLDRPFQIGDWINFDGVDGTVEEVGIRATRVRTFENSLVYVPNGQLANMTVNNYGLRVYRRFNTKIAITYDTPSELIEKFTEGLKLIVDQHPDTRKDFYEIRLNSMGASSLDILFYIFFAVPDWSRELKAREEILLSIIDLAYELGIRFAFPTSTLFVEEVPGQPSLTPERQKLIAESEARLQSYREHLEGKKK